MAKKTNAKVDAQPKASKADPARGASMDNPLDSPLDNPLDGSFEEAPVLGAALEEDAVEEGASADPALRPRRLEDFSGQPDCVRQLRIAVDAARSRSEALDHTLFFGPPGLGKTTLAQIVASEMGFAFKGAAAPSIARPGDLASILACLEPDSVLFLDEIHRLNKVAAELLYMAMEDRRLDLVVGEGMSAKSVSIPLPPFTLVGATTRPGMLPPPLRDRFGLHLRLEFYNDADLAKILERTAALIGFPGDGESFLEVARRSRGTPRVAKRLLRRVRDFAHSKGAAAMEKDLVVEALDVLGVDAAGLDAQDRRYLEAMLKFYGGGPVGVETLAATLSEDREILETAVEPYLMMRGLVQRTPRGRALTPMGRRLLSPSSSFSSFPPTPPTAAPASFPSSSSVFSSSNSLAAPAERPGAAAPKSALFLDQDKDRPKVGFGAPPLSDSPIAPSQLALGFPSTES